MRTLALPPRLLKHGEMSLPMTFGKPATKCCFHPSAGREKQVRSPYSPEFLSILDLDKSGKTKASALFTSTAPGSQQMLPLPYFISIH